MKKRWTRRDFIRDSGLGVASLTLGGVGCEGGKAGLRADALAADAGTRADRDRKPNIAVIGAGPAGLSAAFHLTRDPDWRRRYDVTVYQLGWRLGGKGATGRNLADGFGARIEEHGIHGFCRFYFNTWQMLKEVYRELTPADRELLPAKTIEEAFLPSSVTYSVEFRDGWRSATDYMPITSGLPWDDGALDLSFGALMRNVYQAARDRGRRDVGSPVNDPAPGGEPATSRPLTDRTIDRLLAESADRHSVEPQFDQDASKLEGVLRDWIRDLEALTPERSDMADEARIATVGRSRTLSTVDFYLAIALGLARERLSALLEGRRWDLDDLDDIDYRAWLRRHGAAEHTLSSPIVYGVANILFAYPGGDSTQPPRLSAASWLSWIARSLLGRGEYFYFLAAGTGETVILPLYLLLKRRGVRFEFFHKLVGMRSVDDPDSHEQLVEELHFERQTQLAERSEYDPLLKLPGLGYHAWPSQPRWELLSGVNKSSGVDFEAWESSALKAEPRVLKRGSGFDYVVWAMPPSMIPLIGDDRLRNAWADVNAHLTTTSTQAVQFWLTRDTKDLGWPRSQLRPPGTARYASGSFPNPLNGCVAFDDLIGHEEWSQDGPKGLVYLCSQLVDSPRTETREEERLRVRSAALGSLRLMGHFLGEGQDPARPGSLDFGLLYDPRPGSRGEERLDYQYVRANTRPTEAYVQAPPGGLRGRLDAWDSGYANLVPAGDWIRTGFNLGSFESAVTGGKLAAFALAGTPAIETVVGYRLWHAKAGDRIRSALLRGPRISPA